MAKPKQAAEPSAAIAGANDQPYAVALELLERLSLLRLVYRAIDGVGDVLPDNKELSAARNQLRRLLGEINSLHSHADLLSGLLSRCTKTAATALECVRPAAEARELPRGALGIKARRLS